MTQDRYRVLFERSADAILIIVGNKFVDCNEATVKMLRYKNKQDLLDTHPSQLSPERQSDGRMSYEKAEEMIATAFQNGSNRFEWDHLRADGEVFPVEVLLTAVQEEKEPALHVVWREISDRKKVEAALQKSFEELEQGIALPDAVRYGVACGAANALTLIAGTVKRTDVCRLLRRVVVTRR